jgi:toxin ParE1/3/4
MAARPLIIHPEAAAEAEAALDWYAQKSALAARVFLLELSHAMEAVAAAPERWPRHDRNFRKYIFPNFPYVLFYRMMEGQLQMVALAHTKRRPGYWKDR